MLIDLLRRAAEERPERAVVSSCGGTTTYADALSRAEWLGRGLRARGIDRFGSVVDDQADVLVLLAGSSAAGAEACLYPRGLEPGDIERFASRFGHGIVVADSAISPTSARVVRLDELGVDDEPGEPGPDPDATVLILTTGTTGKPKGVRHAWSRLVSAADHPDDRPGRKWLLAYNLNQFAGIQILLHVLVNRATLVVPRSNLPRDALLAMRDESVTHVSATPTFWRLLVGSIDTATADTLALEQITLGGEAATALLIDRLRELFPRAQVSHVYAGTEFGSVVSVRDGRAGLPASVLERDETSPVRMRIVEGELQVRSRAGMLGYYGGGKTELNWHPTGDLVELKGDRIHFVGRTTDVINVGGAKVHPLPIEEVVSAVDGVKLVAAFGRQSPVTGQIVVVDVVASPQIEPEALRSAIRTACNVLPPAARPRRIRFVDTLDVHGEKLMRRKLREKQDRG